MTDKTDEQKAAELKAAEAKAAGASDDAKATGKTKVRVLADHDDHKANDVLSLSAAEAKIAVAAGWADDNPAAVKYAEGLKKAAPDAALAPE